MLRLPFVFSRRSVDRLSNEIQKLRTSNEHLREKLASAQQAKLVAENQAEELRKGKERIRSKNAALKKSLEQSERVNETLEARITSLTEALETHSSGAVSDNK